MGARSITALDRDLLDDPALDRLEELLDFETDPDPIGEEWPHDHPPGAARRIERSGRDDADLASDEELDDFLEAPREPLDDLRRRSP